MARSRARRVTAAQKAATEARRAAAAARRPIYGPPIPPQIDAARHQRNVDRAMPQWKAGGIRPDKRAVLAAKGKQQARQVLKYAKAHKGRTGLAMAGAATAAAVVRNTGSGVDKGGRGRPTGMYGY